MPKQLRIIKSAVVLLLVITILFTFPAALPVGAASGSLENEVWSFGVMGDTQWTCSDDPTGLNPGAVSVSVIDQLNQQFIDAGVKFVIQTGDLINYNGDIAERAAAAQALYDAGIGFFPMRGNHEVYNDPVDFNVSRMQSLFPQNQGLANTFGAVNFSSPLELSTDLNGLSYAFDYGTPGHNATFVILDVMATPSENQTYAPATYANGYTIADQQYWISECLDQATRGTEHAFVFSHPNLIGENHYETLFTGYPDNNTGVQNDFLACLQDNGVEYYISAHEHLHQRSLITSPDGLSSVQEIICASDGPKFINPKDPSLAVWSEAKTRQTPLSQELNTIGYYIYTIDGSRVTVDYYTDDHGNWQSDNNWPNGAGDDNMITPTFNFIQKESWSYDLNGETFLVSQGEDYSLISDTSPNGTGLQVLAGTNDSAALDYWGRPFTACINTGWEDARDGLVSDIVTLSGMAEDLGSRQTSQYVLSLSYDSAAADPDNLALLTLNSAGQWVKAVAKNFGGSENFVAKAWNSSFGLGSYGVDTASSTVWAVLNNQGSFAVGYPTSAGTGAKAKNVIIMISDGMGFNTMLTADYYQYGETGSQVYQDFPVQLAVSTYEYESLSNPYPYDYTPPFESENPDYVVYGYDSTLAWSDFNYARWMVDNATWAPYNNNSTDSSSAATAMSTGHKTKDGYVGVDINQAVLPNIVEYAERLDKATGVVTTVPFSHATPAGFVTHLNDRNNYAALAQQMIYDSAVDVILGCGAPDFSHDGTPVAGPYSESKAKYVGGVDAWNDITDDASVTGADADGDGLADDWSVIRTRAEFLALAEGDTPERVLGIPEVNQTLQYYRGGDGYADAYAVPFNSNVPTLAEMSRAALNVLDNDADGFFLMIEGGAVDWCGHFFQPGRLIEEQIDFNYAVEAVVDWVETNSSWDETLLVVTADHETGYVWGPGSDPTWEPVVNNGAGVMPGFDFYSIINGPGYTFGWHTNSLVPLFARGPGAALYNDYADELDSVRGSYIDNTEHSPVFTSALSGYDTLLDLNAGGWSLISTDRCLDAAVSAFEGEVSLVYKYTSEGYLSASLADLTPVNAIYVKTTGRAVAGLNYDDNAQPGVSIVDLDEGWNLISCASADSAADILSPLRYATIGGVQGVCLSTLVSQGGYNLYSDGFYLDTTNWDNLEEIVLNPFDGYWVYLNAPKSFGVVLP